MNINQKSRLSVAPMMDWTDRHYRYFARLLSRRAVLYTEMVTTGAVLHGDREQLLGFDASETPLVLQLGGSEPKALAHCARIGQDWGYDGINLNVGCPSDRVQSGRFGACLMAEPEQVARCIAAMQAEVSIPVTVKCRLGIDEQDDYLDLERFVDKVSAAGCQHFIVHARKAWLNGLSPKENRDIPPLRYENVHRLKQRFTKLRIGLNGGVLDLDQALTHLEHVDEIMVGRAAYHNPWLLAGVDPVLHNVPCPVTDRHAAIEALLPYVEAYLSRGGRLQHISRHLLGLFQGQHGGRRWRRHLSEHAHRDGAGCEVLEQALALVPRQFDKSHNNTQSIHC